MATRQSSGAGRSRSARTTPAAAQHDHGTHDHGAHDDGMPDEACPECVIAGHAHHDHAQWDHFPSDVELEEAGVIEPVPTDTELARAELRARRMSPWSVPPPIPSPPSETVPSRPNPAPFPESVTVVGRDLREHLIRPLPWWREDLLGPLLSRGIINLIGSYRRVRRNEATLTRAERERFNAALSAMDGNPAWQTLMDYHVGGTYRMHSMHGATGRQRFLPWHRRYLFAAEQLLRTVEPTITIPYWDYGVGSSRPDWVHRPSGVNRPGPGTSGLLPSGSTIATILARGDYSTFTGDLESNAHNQVHNWCGGTLGSPSTASFDPIFWMLHGNVDRLWAVWQETHTDPVLHAPSLTGTERMLDPWTSTVSDVDQTAWDLGYRYG